MHLYINMHLPFSASRAENAKSPSPSTSTSLDELSITSSFLELETVWMCVWNRGVGGQDWCMCV